MHKKLIIFATILSFGLFAAFAPSAFAEETATDDYRVMPISETSDETAPDEPTEESEEEPAMWPVYLSLGAIGATFLLIIIINLSGRKYNKK